MGRKGRRAKEALGGVSSLRDAPERTKRSDSRGIALFVDNAATGIGGVRTVG
jgi:hypothetical protein